MRRCANSSWNMMTAQRNIGRCASSLKSRGDDICDAEQGGRKEKTAQTRKDKLAVSRFLPPGRTDWSAFCSCFILFCYFCAKCYFPVRENTAAIYNNSQHIFRAGRLKRRHRCFPNHANIAQWHRMVSTAAAAAAASRNPCTIEQHGPEPRQENRNILFM